MPSYIYSYIWTDCHSAYPTTELPNLCGRYPALAKTCKGYNVCRWYLLVFMLKRVKICSYSIFANLKKQPTAKSQLQSLESDVGQNKNINFPKKIIYWPTIVLINYKQFITNSLDSNWVINSEQRKLYFPLCTSLRICFRKPL